VGHRIRSRDITVRRVFLTGGRVRRPKPIWRHTGPATRGNRIEGVRFVKGGSRGFVTAGR